MVRINGIRYSSICDGEGLRNVVFLQGCLHMCDGCHNPETWDMRNGTRIKAEDLTKFLMESNPNKQVTISGGDPFAQPSGLLDLLFHLKHAGANIWVYTGYTLEELMEMGYTSHLQYIDVLVDGRYDKTTRVVDGSVPFRGSANQRLLRRGVDY